MQVKQRYFYLDPTGQFLFQHIHYTCAHCKIIMITINLLPMRKYAQQVGLCVWSHRFVYSYVCQQKTGGLRPYTAQKILLSVKMLLVFLS